MGDLLHGFIACFFNKNFPLQPARSGSAPLQHNMAPSAPLQPPDRAPSAPAQPSILETSKRLLQRIARPDMRPQVSNVIYIYII